jgi:cell pole-organizing protein PopZ
MDDQIAAIRAAAGVQAEEEDDGDLELTQKVETHGDLDFVEAEPAPEPPPTPEPEPLALDEAPSDGLVSASVAAAAAATFGRLSSGVLMPAEGRTLEDVVRELLRPMLQQWLDDNLPGIVQQAVEAEVERISRGRVR